MSQPFRLSDSDDEDESISDANQGSEDTSLIAMLQFVQEQIAALYQSFESKIHYDEVKNRQITVLHQEVQSQREGLHWRILRPIFLDLIMLYDDLETECVRFTNTSEIGKVLLDFRATVEEILFRHGVEKYSSDTSAFNKESHRSIRTVTTTDPALDLLIAHRIRNGFKYEGHILRPEWVETYRFVPDSKGAV